MTNVIQNVYPKDLTMSMASNHIEREKKLFTTAEDRIFVPDGGPFYSQSLILKDNNGVLLKPVVDYKLLYLNEEATIESGRDVVAVIWILKETLPYVMVDYRVVGGPYGNTVNAIMQEITKAGPIQRNVDWNINVYGKPSQYPAAPHYHTPNTFTDWSMVYVQLEGIRKAIIVGDDVSWESHYNYIDRKMSSVEQNINTNLNNFATKTFVAQAISAVDFRVDMSAYYNKYQVDNLFTQVDAGINNITNDVGVNFYTKTQSDARYPLATTVYTKLQGDARYMLKSDAYTKGESDGKYATQFQLGNYATNNSITQLETRLNQKITQVEQSGGTDLSGYYTKLQTYAKSEVFSKTETYGKTETYAKAEVYPKTGTYSKPEVDSLIRGIPAPDLSNYYKKSETFTKTEISNLVNDSMSSVLDFDPDVYYTKLQVDALIESAISRLVMSGTALSEVVVSLGGITTIMKQEGWAFGTFWPTSHKRGAVNSRATFNITLPVEYDPLKHKIESPSHPLFTISGRTFSLSIPYQQFTGYKTESGYGGEKFPYTYFAASATISIRIVQK